MRFLLISFCFLFVGCASYPKKNNFQESEIVAPTILNPYFSDATLDYVYKAQITVYDTDFSGLFIVKKIAIDEHRVVFTTEMGNKIVDFSFTDDDFKVNYALKDFDKKGLINLLQQDFKVLIEEYPIVAKSYILDEQEIVEAKIYNKKYYYYYLNQQLQRIAKVSSGKEKSTFLFSGINGNLATAIEIIHPKIKINLKSI